MRASRLRAHPHSWHIGKTLPFCPTCPERNKRNHLAGRQLSRFREGGRLKLTIDNLSSEGLRGYCEGIARV